MSIKDHVKGFSTFQSYRAGYFYYQTEDGFEFVVPLDDIEGSTLNRVEKSIFFMRWIRKQMDASKEVVVKTENG